MRNGVRFALLVGIGLLTAAVGYADKPANPPADKPGDKPPAAAEPKVPTKKELMAAKLKHTQSILEGIAVNDLDKVLTGSDELVRVMRANDFLNAYKGEEYRFQLKLFERAAESVGKKAKDKNMDGVLVAYHELTVSCLKCHQAMRDKKFDARLPQLDPPARGE